jgi:uncharacterized protein YaiI (UPF0178 family)
MAKENYIDCFIFCDTSHVFEKTGATTMIFSKGADSVDFALVNRVLAGDIVITQDYGLAAMCLSKNAIVINQDGHGIYRPQYRFPPLYGPENPQHRRAAEGPKEEVCGSG